MRVDSEGKVVFVRVTDSPQCGVLRAEELTQVFVEHKNQLCHTCWGKKKSINEQKVKENS